MYDLLYPYVYARACVLVDLYRIEVILSQSGKGHRRDNLPPPPSTAQLLCLASD